MLIWKHCDEWKMNTYENTLKTKYENKTGNVKTEIPVEAIVPTVLDNFNRNEKYTFYYDETNYFGKFWVEERQNIQPCFNFDIDKDFVLAGIVTRNEHRPVDKEQLWQRLHLSPQVKELKFKKQFSMPDFVQTLGKGRVNQFLHYIDEQGYYIHVAHVNAFYYSIVDIVDSVLSLEDIEEYKGTNQLDFRYELNRIKAQLFELLYPCRAEVAALFSVYEYPDLKKENMDEFCQKLVKLFGSRRELSMDLKFLSGMIQKAGKQKDLVFLERNIPNVLMENLAFLYFHFIALFPNSKHIFDNQQEIRRKVDKYVVVDGEKNKLENYEYVDSKNEIMIQISDVISGIWGMLYSFLNEHDNNGIRKMVSELNKEQLDSLWMMWKLMHDAEQENRGFIFSFASIQCREKLQLLGRLAYERKTQKEKGYGNKTN